MYREPRKSLPSHLGLGCGDFLLQRYPKKGVNLYIISSRMAKAKKTRADKYDSKLAIKGNFLDVIKVSVGKTPEPPAKKEETPKKKETKK